METTPPCFENLPADESVFRTYLRLLRRKRAVKNGLSFQEWFCAKHPQLPPLPKPSGDEYPSQHQPQR